MRDEIKTKTTETLVFGGFQYECGSARLTDSEGNIVHMRRQSADVLALLAEHRGEIVSREQFMERVWPDAVTTDDSLVQCIADIRRTVGRKSIVTFPKKGYQLNFDVSKQIIPIQKNSNRLPIWLGVITAFTFLAILAVRQQEPEPDQNRRVLPIVKQEKSLAVLPFTNLDNVPDIEFFSNGLSEDLSTDLSKVAGLTVISHLSSFKYPNVESGFNKIAKDLGVRYLVRGTVRHETDRVRINVALVDTEDGFNIWADRYDRDRNNPFDVQEEVTREIVQALSLALGVKNIAAGRIDPDAYYMLLRGLEPLRKLTSAGNMEAREYFERALELNPQYARAYANVAITHAREIVQQQSRHSDASIERGLEAAITAIQIDANNPQAYYALGWLNLAIEEFDTALSAVRHAIKLDGNYSDGYALLAQVDLFAGDLNEALTAIKRAKLLHPHHPPSYHWTEGHILYQLGRFDEAQLILEEAAHLSTHFPQGHVVLAATYGQLGNTEKAANAFSVVKAKTSVADVINLASQIPYDSNERRSALITGLEKAKLN